MTDIRACLAEGADRLAGAGIANAWREARLLLAHATGFSQAMLIGYPERVVDAYDQYARLVERRAAREPMSHLTGRREFWSLDFEVTPDTLDPRPDSEAVVEAALEFLPDLAAKLRIADLGTGTGCLLAALLSMLPAAQGIGVDRSRAAAAVACRNLMRLGLADRAHVIVGDWAGALGGPFDLIVANPPYIPSAEVASLQPEVALFEPVSALDGGTDGFDSIRAVAAALPALLADGGAAVIEFGDGQDGAVTQIAGEVGLFVRDVRKDLAGRTRCMVCALTES
ncbi:MAG: peptide chain release factor N(5)-glutamine methyltransferase [Alphaproteobacteria bacterium]|nr:peptide chain release factor N(5)-glutamine methyltransferase [Alphaproteobacteria bacterium]